MQQRALLLSKSEMRESPKAVVTKEVLIPMSDFAPSFERNRAAFYSLKEKVLDNKAYAGQYIAILDGKVVGKNSDKSELAKKTYKKYGYVPIFFGKIADEKRYVDIPSVEKM